MYEHSPEHATFGALPRYGLSLMRSSLTVTLGAGSTPMEKEGHFCFERSEDAVICSVAESHVRETSLEEAKRLYDYETQG